MSDVFSAAFDVIFTNPNMAAECLYAPNIGESFNVRAISVAPEDHNTLFSTHAWLPSLVLEVRVSELAQPKEGDSITYKGQTHVVRNFKKIDDRMLWRLNLA